jgi:hypothetical protein
LEHAVSRFSLRALPAIRPVRLALLLFAVCPLALAAPATARMPELSGCRSDALLLSRVVSETTASAQLLANTSQRERCAVYRHLFLNAVRARDAAVSCNAGGDLGRSVARLDGAIEAMNGGIAENCGSE